MATTREDKGLMKGTQSRLTCNDLLGRKAKWSERDKQVVDQPVQDGQVRKIPVASDGAHDVGVLEVLVKIVRIRLHNLFSFLGRYTHNARQTETLRNGPGCVRDRGRGPSL